MNDHKTGVKFYTKKDWDEIPDRLVIFQEPCPEEDIVSHVGYIYYRPGIGFEMEFVNITDDLKPFDEDFKEVVRILCQSLGI